MSDEYGVDLDEVFKVIDAADVLVVRFQIVQKRLLIDFRTADGVGPYIAVVAPAQSMEERVRSIKRMRPELPYPERLMSFHWRRSIEVLVASGTWQRIADRVALLGGDAGEEACGRVLRELFDEERAEVTGAIRGGDRWQTLWQREGA